MDLMGVKFNASLIVSEKFYFIVVIYYCTFSVSAFNLFTFLVIVALMLK